MRRARESAPRGELSFNQIRCSMSVGLNTRTRIGVATDWRRKHAERRSPWRACCWMHLGGCTEPGVYAGRGALCPERKLKGHPPVSSRCSTPGCRSDTGDGLEQPSRKPTTMTNESDWRRRHALQIASMLPDTLGDALDVLDFARELVTGFLDQRPAPVTIISIAVVKGGRA